MFEKKDTNSEESKSKLTINDPLLFLIGVALLAAGLFMLSKRVIVHSNWYSWRIGGFDLPSGTVIIPFIIGVIWYFYNPKSMVAKAIITLSILFIVLTIIMSVSINFVATSMFDYILIFTMTAAGTGILLRTIFKKKE